MSGGTLHVTDVPAPYVWGVILIFTCLKQEHIPVLVIDDNTDTLTLFQRYLSGSQYQFTGISDPEEVLQQAAEISPQFILLDVMLPGTDGWELLGRLREYPQTRTIPYHCLYDIAAGEIGFGVRCRRLFTETGQPEYVVGGVGASADGLTGRGVPSRGGDKIALNVFTLSIIWCTDNPLAVVTANALLTMGWPKGSRAEMRMTGISRHIGLLLPGFQELKAIHLGHRQVQKDNIW